MDAEDDAVGCGYGQWMSSDDGGIMRVLLRE